MGGDAAPGVVINGLQEYISSRQDINFIIFGDKTQVVNAIKKCGIKDSSKLTIQHCTEVVSGHTEPRQAIRSLKDSSMRKAIESVAMGDSDGVVSAGNTGAYMALSKLILKTLPGINRPAITSIIPTKDDKGIVMLDLGANAEVIPENLVQFCIMGQAFAKCVQGVKSPSVALLNIGTEESKGNSVVKEAHRLIQTNTTIKDYLGFVEGNDIFKGTADVIVADGFTGNVAIKTAEGTLKTFAEILKNELSKHTLAKIGMLIAKPALSSLKHKLDPNIHNGAPFLGLQKVSVKSHGGTNSFGFASAIKVAVEMIENKINDKITQEICNIHLDD